MMVLRIRTTCAAFLLLLAAAVPTLAAPGSGSAAFVPPISNVAAGTAGTWTIRYTASEPFQGGQLTLTIPTGDGWTTPSDGAASNPGYVTVSTNEPTGTPTRVVSGSTITVTVDTLSAGRHVDITYGDTGGGANPTAAASAPQSPLISTFAVSSDPTSTSPVTIGASPTLTVDPATPFRLDIQPAGSTVTAGVFSPYKVFVVDEFDNRTPVTQIRTVSVFPTSGGFYLPSDHVTPIATFNLSAGQDSINIDYRATVATAGSPNSVAMITFDGNTPSLGGQADISVDPAVVNAAASTVAATSPVVADGASTSVITITARDEFGNAVPGASTVLSVVLNAQLSTATPPPTDAGGVTSATATNTTAETETVSAVINGVAIAQQASIVFTADTVDPDSSRVQASPVSQIADGVSKINITVTARDVNGNPIAGKLVSLSVAPPGNGAALSPDGVTDANGQYFGSLTSTKTGPRVVSATIDGQLATETAAVTFTPGPIGGFVWTHDGAATAGVAESVSVSAFDTQGNAKSDYTGTVSFTTTASGNVVWAVAGAQGTLTPTGPGSADYTFAVADNGVATFTVTNQVAETYLLLADDGGAGGTSSPIAVAPAAVSAVVSTIAATTPVTADGVATSSVTVTSRDSFGNPRVGDAVVLSPSGSAVVNTPPPPTNSAGVAIATVTNTEAEIVTVGATIQGVPINDTAPIEFIADAVDADSSTVAATSPVVADGIASSTITVTAKDANGNPVAGKLVTLSVTPPGQGAVLSPAGITDESGIYRGSLTSTKTGDRTVTANIDGVPVTGSANVTFVPGPIGSFTWATDGSAVAGVAEAVTITAFDTQGNRKTDYTGPVSLSTTASDSVLWAATSGSMVQTGADEASYTFAAADSGMATVQATNRLAELYLLFADDAGKTGTSDLIDVVPAPVDPAVSSIAAVSPVTADGSLSTVTVTSRDAFGNPRGGDTVTLIPVSGAASLVQPGATGSDGRTVGAAFSSTANTFTLSAQIGGVPISSNAQVVFVPGGADPDSSTVNATASVVADGSSEATITVTATDASGNPVPGKTVVLSVIPTGDGEVLTQPSLPTDINGQTSGMLTSTKTGPRIVSATIDGVPITDSAGVSFIPGAVASFQWSVAPGIVPAGTAKQVTITALDAQNNVVTDYAGLVNLSATADSVAWGSFDAVNPPVKTGDATANFTFDPGDGGSATLLVTNKIAGSFQVIASGEASGTSTAITVDHAAADIVVLVTGDGQSGTVFTPVGTSPKVRVTDTWGNPVDNETVTFAATVGGGSVDAIAGGGTNFTRNTDASGEVQCDVWTLGQLVGSNQMTASIIGGSSPVFTFTASSTAGPGASLVLSPGTQSITVGQSLVVTAELRDQFTNLVPGERVDVVMTGTTNGTLAADGSNPNPTFQTSATSRWGNTDASGTITVVFNASSTAGITDTVDGFSTNVPQGSVLDAAYTTTAAGLATQYRINVVSPTVSAGTNFEFTVDAVDNGDNIDPGYNGSVTLTPQGGSGIIFALTSDLAIPVTSVTISGGSSPTVYGRGTTAGDWDVTAEIGLGPDTEQITITDTGVVASYAVTAVDSVVAGESFNVDVEARDAFGNRVMSAGNTVNFSAVLAADSTQAAGGSLLTPQATLVAGVATVAQDYRLAETIRVKVDGASSEGFSAPLKVKPAAANRIAAAVTADTSGVVAGANRTIIVEVFDSFDNLVSAEPVFFSVITGDSVTPGTSVTGPAGRASAAFTTSAIVGFNDVRAFIDDGSPARERVGFTVTTVAGPIDYYTVIPAKTTVAAGELTAVDVAAFDTNNNPVVLDNTTQIQLTSDGDAVFADPIGQLVSGEFSTMVSDTIAEVVTLTAETLGGGPPSGSSAPVTVNPAAEYIALPTIPATGDTIGITVGAAQILEVEVRDRFGNTVPGVFVTFQFDPSTVDPGSGLLSNTVTTTNGSGRATSTLTTSPTVGDNLVKATIGDGIPPGLEVVNFTVSTTAAGIAYYEVITDLDQQTAGQPVTVTVRARDGADNLVVDNSTNVLLTLDPGFDPVWGTLPPITLAAGTLQTTLTVDTTQIYQVRASTSGAPGITGLSDPVTIDPDVPFGAIVAVAIPDTITANTLSTSDISTDVIRDQFGNPVAPGELVSIVPSIGSIDTPDENPGTPGVNDQAVKADGTVSYRLRSGTVPGTATVAMSSVNGSALGLLNVQFALIPAFACNVLPVPSVVIAGDSVSFSVQVANTSGTGAMLGVGTTMEFTDNGNSFSANLSVQTYVPGDGTPVILVFDSEPVNALMTPGLYQPLLRMAGVDEFDQPFSNITCTLPAASVNVTAVRITQIVTPTLPVNRGDTATIRVFVENPSAATVTVNTIPLDFLPVAPPGRVYVQQTPINFPRVVLTQTTEVIEVPVFVDGASTTGIDSVDAFITADVLGSTATDRFSSRNSVLPTIEVIEGASLEYLAGSLTPTVVSRGQTHQFSVLVRNNGDATVTLNASGSELSFTDLTSTFTSTLVQDKGIAGGATEQLLFNLQTVPPAMLPGLRDVRIALAGTEGGQAFSDTLTTAGAGDQVSVKLPASISAGIGVTALLPDTVSLGATVPFTVRMNNIAGIDGATLVLDPALTTIRFAGGVYTAALDPNGPTTLPPGPTDLLFLSATVDNSIVPQAYTPTVHLEGTENLIPGTSDVLLNDGVVVQEAPDLAILAITTSQPAITADQVLGITVDMVVRNNGGATVNFTSATIQFILGGTNRTAQFTIPPVASFIGGSTLAGGATDIVRFNVSDNLGNAMSAGNMTIEGEIEVFDPNPPGIPITANTNTGGKGSLLVQTRAVLGVLSVTTSQEKVTEGATLLPASEVEVRVAIRNTGQSSAKVDFGASDLVFSPVSLWGYAIRPAMVSGDSILSGGEIDTLVFDINQIGSNPGPTGIDAIVEGTELNSLRRETRNTTGLNLGSLLVQQAGNIVITAVTPSRASITSGSSVTWQVVIDIENQGEADVDLNLVVPSSGVLILNENPLTIHPTRPALEFGGGTLLAGGQQDRLVVDLAQSGVYDAFGNQQISAFLAGIELNHGNSRSATDDLSSVRVQRQPVLVYRSLEPDTVSTGTSVAFQIMVANPLDSAATAVIDPAQTNFTFNGGTYVADLEPGSTPSVAARDSVLLQFAAETVPGPGTPSDMALDLHWMENARADNALLPLPTGDLEIQIAPQLSIVGITATPSTITTGQDGWTVTMEVENNGGVAVQLDLDPSATRLGFSRSSDGANLNIEYAVTPPTALENAGNNILGPGATDQMIFAVDMTGSTPGAMLISGVVAGIDLNNSQPVSDNTVDGGAGNLTVQMPGALQITSITPEQPTVTASQTGYEIWMEVENTGGADVTLRLVSDSTSLDFGAATGWGAVPLATLRDNGGTVLGGGEVDTVTFFVFSTGTQPVAIEGIVRGFETNRAPLAVIDDTGDGGSGAIIVQSAAQLTIDSVTPSQLAVTQGSPVAWSIDVAVTNGGDADIELTLPDSLTVSIADATGTVFDPVFELEGGGRILSGNTSGVLRVNVSVTGTPVSPGTNKAIGVRLAGRETNSSAVVADNGTGSVRVDSAPVLSIVGITPSSVSAGTVEPFQVDVTNSGTATVVLRGETRLQFVGGFYTAVIAQSSADTVLGGQTATLQFEPKLVDDPPSVTPYVVQVNFTWTSNGQLDGSSDTFSGVTVQSPPQLAINQLSIDLANPTGKVTAGQDSSWSVIMEIENNGGADLDIVFDSASTLITFDLPGGGQDPTYTIIYPTTLEGGGTVLPTAGTRQLRFLITETGTSTGLVTINGQVTGRDGPDIITGDTFAGGRATIEVQSEANVVVKRIRPRATVTAGQTAPWPAFVVIENLGESDAQLDLPGAKLLFSGGTGWSVGTVALVGGGDVLLGGAEDSLIINVDTTAFDPALRTVSSAFTGIEINNGRALSADTASALWGMVEVQSPPFFVIGPTDLTAPRAPHVNHGQATEVQVTIENTGDADATNIDIDVTSGDSTPTAVQQRIPLLEADSTAVLTFPVIASPTLDLDTLGVRFVQAQDANSGALLLRPAFTGLSLIDTLATLQIQDSSRVVVDSVRTNVPAVTRGQSAPWTVTVYVSNKGHGPLELDPFSPDDLVFTIGGTEQFDYVVTEPAGTVTLDSLESNALNYTIALTGNGSGMVDIGAFIDATDLNEGFAHNDAGGTSIQVNDPAGLFVASTVADSVFNVQPLFVRVNTRQQFKIKVTVENTGEIVDNVSVALASNGNSTVLGLEGSNYRSLGDGETSDFVFLVEADSLPNPLESFTSVIDSAISRNTQLPVMPQQAVDDEQVVDVQTPASLSLSFAVSHPPGATQVSEQQVFRISAVVTNSGQALTFGGGELTITNPGDYTPIGGSAPSKTFAAVGDSVHWRFRTPTTPPRIDTLVCRITQLPNDVNIDADANAPVDTAAFALEIREAGALSNSRIAIESPPGAVDRILSAGQRFGVRVFVTLDGDAENVTGTLSVPAGFSIVGSPTVSLPAIIGEVSDTLQVIAPAVPASTQQLKVVFDATDVNSGGALADSMTMDVDVVSGPALTLNARVDDNTVSPGEVFTFYAWVNNSGTAAISGTQELTLTVPGPGYTLPDSDPVKTFNTVPDTVQWRVRAPDAPSAGDQLTARISSQPVDENDSREPAQILVGTAQIAMVTEGAQIVVSNQSSALDTRVVPGGERNVEKLRFTMNYSVGDPTGVADASVDTIKVTVLGPNGSPLSAGAVRTTVRRLFIDLGGAQPVEVLGPTENPIAVFAGNVAIAPNTTAAATVGIDLQNAPPVQEIRLQVRSTGLLITDSQTGQGIGIVDSGSQQPLDGQLTSDPLVILSNDFSEYAHNYPNPFRAGEQDTKITYKLDSPSSVSIKVYTLTGELVHEENIAQGSAGSTVGAHEATWSGHNGAGEVVRNGLYVCVINAGSKSAKFRIAVAK